MRRLHHWEFVLIIFVIITLASHFIDSARRGDVIDTIKEIDEILTLIE